MARRVPNEESREVTTTDTSGTGPPLRVWLGERSDRAWPALQPPNRRPAVVGSTVIAVFVASALCLGLAPALMPDSYSWVRLVISETAAQGVAFAWVTRTGFVLSAIAVLLLAGSRADGWGRRARTAHRVYALLVLGLAVFSQRSWTGASFDRLEDTVHLSLAPVAGVVFTGAVLLVALRRRTAVGWVRLLDVITLSAMLVLPLVMIFATGLDGVAQRTAVVIGYLWYGAEAARLIRSSGPAAMRVRT